MYQYVLKLNIAVLCKYQSTIYIIFIQMKSVIGCLNRPNVETKTYYFLSYLHP